jgi:predicted 3-demethylubiquinone-9 3-methyltransferase (glyoxalase superfamily)
MTVTFELYGHELIALKSKRVFETMLKMKKIDTSTLERAYQGR